MCVNRPYRQSISFVVVFQGQFPDPKSCAKRLFYVRVGEKTEIARESDDGAKMAKIATTKRDKTDKDSPTSGTESKR